jgi:hypothetical protein
MTQIKNPKKNEKRIQDIYKAGTYYGTISIKDFE